MKISHLESLYRNSTRISKFILSLLNKFEVALQFDKENLILPSLLPTDQNLKPTMMKEVCCRLSGLRTYASWLHNVLGLKAYTSHFLLSGQ